MVLTYKGSFEWKERLCNDPLFDYKHLSVDWDC